MKEDFLLARVCCDVVVDLEEAGGGLEVDLVDDWLQAFLGDGVGELEGFGEGEASAGVACKINLFIDCVVVYFLLSHFKSSKQSDVLIQAVNFSVLVRIVDDVAESSGKCSIETDFGRVFGSARLVQVGINEGLHRVDVQDVARYFVSWIR